MTNRKQLLLDAADDCEGEANTYATEARNQGVTKAASYRRIAAEGVARAAELRTWAAEFDTTVPVPTNVDQAALMVLLGMQWLEAHAPHRIRRPEHNTEKPSG